MDLIQPLTILGGIILGSGILGFAGKRALENVFAALLDTHRANLQHASNTEIARLTHELQIQAKEHETQFQRLHEQRATIIARLYELLIDLRMEAGWTRVHLRNGTVTAERLDTMTRSHSTLENYYHPNVIWFDMATCEALDQLLSRYGESWNIAFDSAVGEDSDNEEFNQWANARIDEISREIEESQAALENEFRKLLGIQSGRPAAGPNP